MEKLFTCHDGSLAPVLGRLNERGKWELYQISKVLGMGSAEYELKASKFEYDELVALNSFSGTSYIATSINHKWGLLELKDNGEAKCKLTILSEIKFNSLESLLSAFGIDQADYWCN